MECPEQAAISYIDGYTPKKLSEPLEGGSIMHFCLEHQFNYPSPEACVQSVCEQYRKWRIPTLLHTKERDALECLLGLCEVTFPRYARYWNEDDSRIPWIKRESKFRVPYEVSTPEGPRKLYLRGMRDGLYRVPNTGSLGVFETKNKARIVDDDIKDGLKADMQTMFYVWATFLETGEMPEQVIYNVIRRTTLYRRKGDARKKTAAETTPQYLKRVAEDIDKAPDNYFLRWRVDLVKDDVIQFVVKTLNPLLIRLIQWEDSLKKTPLLHERWLDGNRSPFHFLNLNALVGKYGKVQEYELIVNNARRHYRLRKEVFPELEESFLVTP